MQPDRIRRAFETARSPPAEALTAAIQHADALAPGVIAVIEKAARGVYLLPAEEGLLFFGVHALAAARHRPLYRPLMRLLRRSDAAIDRLLGDAVGATLASIVLAVFDSDPELLLAVIEDIMASGYVRWALLDVLAQLTEDGAVPRETTTALLDRFERQRLAGDEDAAWLGWQEAILRLGLTDMAERVRASWQDGRNPQREPDRRDWETRLEAVGMDARSAERLIGGPHAPLDDPVAALSWLKPKETPAPKLSRRDAAALALDDDERDWLAGFLACEQVPLSTMKLEELDGFLTALVVGPEPIMPSEYIPQIWGTPDGEGPIFEGEEQLDYFMTLLMRHRNAIGRSLAELQFHLPLIEKSGDSATEGMAWARGFTRGVVMRPAAWEAILQDDKGLAFIDCITLLDRNAPKSPPQAPSLPRAQVLEGLPIAILGLYQFSHEQHAGLGRRRKVGRNEPCPCGSGRKYKRCCGAGGGTAPAEGAEPPEG